MALAAGILIVSLFTSDSMEHLIDVTYFMADRQDATLSFVEKRLQEVVTPVARLPGILAAEPYRQVPARDPNSADLFYQAIKGMPTVSGLASQRASLANFRASLAVLVTTMGSIYTDLAAIIAFGIVYNSARISLSERARELASLRVLAFYVLASVIVLAAALSSALVVRRPADTAAIRCGRDRAPSTERLIEDLHLLLGRPPPPARNCADDLDGPGHWRPHDQS